jgi:hypothetical protein
MINKINKINKRVPLGKALFVFQLTHPSVITPGGPGRRTNTNQSLGVNEKRMKFFNKPVNNLQ